MDDADYESRLTAAFVALMRRYMRHRRSSVAPAIEEHELRFTQEELDESEGLMLIVGVDDEGAILTRLTYGDEEAG